jgi:hypothetical protein
MAVQEKRIGSQEIIKKWVAANRVARLSGGLPALTIQMGGTAGRLLVVHEVDIANVSGHLTLSPVE